MQLVSHSSGCRELFSYWSVKLFAFICRARQNRGFQCIYAPFVTLKYSRESYNFFAFMETFARFEPVSCKQTKTLICSIIKLSVLIVGIFSFQFRHLFSCIFLDERFSSASWMSVRLLNDFWTISLRDIFMDILQLLKDFDQHCFGMESNLCTRTVFFSGFQQC